MKGGGEDLALADQGREAVAAGEDFNAWTGGDDARGADEDHFQRSTREGGFLGDDGGVDLAAVGVPLDGCVQKAQRALRRIEDLPG